MGDEELEVEGLSHRGTPGQIRAAAAAENSAVSFVACDCPSCRPPWGQLNTPHTAWAGWPLCWARLH